jgi:hypothetical protein
MKGISLVLLVGLLFYAGSSLAMTTEAENATIKTAGESIDSGWNHWSNGTVGEYIRIKTAGTMR